MKKSSKIAIVLSAIIIAVLLVMVNVFFVVDVYNKKDYVYCSTGIGSSMYPYIKNGDTLVILTKDYPEFTLIPGDVLVYLHDSSAIAHRIYRISNSRYFVRGDNNQLADRGFVTNDLVIGKVYGVIDQNNFIQKITVEQLVND